LKGLRVYSNTVRRTGWDSINVKGTPENCFVYSNEIYEDSTAQTEEEGGINIALNSRCDVYNNFIRDGYSTGIKNSGIGGKIYNNLIVHPGRGKSSSDTKGSGIQVLMGSSDGSYHIWNNTIVEPRSVGINFSYIYGSDNRIQNNIIVDPGGYGAYGDRSYVFTSWQAKAEVSHNLKTRNLYDVNFVNALQNDFALNAGSPAIDAGLGLDLEGLTFDYQGMPRPQGSGFDIGAFEHSP
jgi:hypothetical protein